MKPVDNTDFWKERIEGSKGTATDHYSVYVANPALWKWITDTHIKLIREHVRGRVLDAGCGYGRMSKLFKPAQYVGVDFSPDFIHWARLDNPEHHFFKEDLKKLPFEDDEFNWAFCVSIKKMIIDNLGEEEWAKMESELKRVAKKVLILEYEAPDEYEIL